MQWYRAPALHISRYNGEKKRFICVSYSWIRLVIGMNHERYQGWIRIGWKGGAGVGGCQLDWSPTGLAGLPTFCFCMAKVSCTTTDIHSLHFVTSCKKSCICSKKLNELSRFTSAPFAQSDSCTVTISDICLLDILGISLDSHICTLHCSYFKGPQEWTKLAVLSPVRFQNKNRQSLES